MGTSTLKKAGETPAPFPSVLSASRRFIGLMMASLLNTLSLASPSSAGPVIEPQLRALTQAALVQGATFPRPPAVTIEAGRNWVDLWLMGRVDPEYIRHLGGSVHTVAGPVMTARLPLESVDALSQAPGLERAQLAQPVRFQSDLSTPETGANLLWGGPPPDFPTSGVTGKRVVIGIVDSGIDVSHPDFRTTSGTRIRWLWDQNFGPASPPPASFSYGSEYSQSDINAGNYACGTCGDFLGHGTHMAGVAAGNGRGTGNGRPAYTYVGVAPEADLVVVSLRYAPDGSITDD